MNAVQSEYIRANTSLAAANVRAAALCKTILPPGFSEENCTDEEMELFVDARLESEARIGYAEVWADYKRAKDALLAWVHDAVSRERAYAAVRTDIEEVFAAAGRNLAAQNKIVEIALRMRA